MVGHALTLAWEQATAHRQMRRLFAFLSNMDAQAWRALLVSFVLFGGVGYGRR